MRIISFPTLATQIRRPKGYWYYSITACAASVGSEKKALSCAWRCRRPEALLLLLATYPAAVLASGAPDYCASQEDAKFAEVRAEVSLPCLLALPLTFLRRMFNPRFNLAAGLFLATHAATLAFRCALHATNMAVGPTRLVFVFISSHHVDASVQKACHVASFHASKRLHLKAKSSA